MIIKPYNKYLNRYIDAAVNGSVFLWVVFYGHYFMGRIAAINSAHNLL